MAENTGLESTYESPRWSQEILDCSMPMSFDTYSKCSYNCLYCFAFFQKDNNVKGYSIHTKGEIKTRSVNVEKVIRLFEGARHNDRSLGKEAQQFYPYIQARKIMQWGGLADGFDEWERRYGVSLELLKYFDKIDYPLSISTKGAWWTEDERYMSLFRKHTHNWHVKISIITPDDVKAKKIEKGVPSSTERLKAIKRLADIGIHVTLRLRPYIIGVSEGWKELIGKAHDAGADSVTTEFFCMECRASERLKKRYEEISNVIGFNIFEFYLKHSKQSGLKRLNRGLKAPIIKKMAEYAHSLGMRFHVSDAFCREYNDSCNCCGVPPEWGVSQTANIGNAIIYAREHGTVKYSDIYSDLDKYMTFSWVKAANYNTGGNRNRSLMYDSTMCDFIHNNWNNIKKDNSPARAYGGILIPCGVDENGDMIYRYNKAAEKEMKK